MSTNNSMYKFLTSHWNQDDIKMYYYNNIFKAKDIEEYSSLIAGFLQQYGIKKGDSVGICLPNIPQAIFSFYAVNQIGAIANVIHPKIGSANLLKLLKKTNTKIVFVLDRMVENSRELLTSEGITIVSCALSTYMKGATKLIRLIEKKYKPPVVDYLDTLSYGKVKEIDFDAKDDAVYIHSGGTTGESKTIVLSNYAFNELVKNSLESVINDSPILSHYNFLMSLPLFHGFGLGVSMHLALYQCKLVLMPLFSVKTVVKLLKKMELNVMAGVPSMLLKLANNKKFNSQLCTKMDLIFSGGDKLKPEIKETIEQVFRKNNSNCKVYEGYGLSEVASVATINAKNVPNCQGQAIANVDLKVIDKFDNILQPNEIGEIVIYSASQMTRYLNSDADNYVMIDGKRYFKTGDVGRVDSQGNFFFTDRIKRIIIIGGVNVYPKDVESIVENFDEVLQSCVVRTKIENKPCTKLLVKLAKNEVLDAKLKKKITETIKKELLVYAVPKIIEEVKEFQLTDVGKINYRYYEEENK